MMQIVWRRVNHEPFEYAIQQVSYGDEFVKLADGSCLRRYVYPFDTAARTAAVSDAGAPETEIEINPEMVAAAVEALYAFPGEIGMEDYPYLAKVVYRAMAAVASRQHEH